MENLNVNLDKNLEMKSHLRRRLILRVHRPGEKRTLLRHREKALSDPLAKALRVENSCTSSEVSAMAKREALENSEAKSEEGKKKE